MRKRKETGHSSLQFIARGNLPAKEICIQLHLVLLTVVSLIRFASVFRPIHPLRLYQLYCSRSVLSQTSSFALGFEKADDIVLSHYNSQTLAPSSPNPEKKRHAWSFDVADNRSSLVIHEFDAHLSDSTTRTYHSLDTIQRFWSRGTHRFDLGLW
jgi:hypothetical protein